MNLNQFKELPHSPLMMFSLKGTDLRSTPDYGRRAALVLVAVACMAGRVGAQEYCVACEGPPAIYRCIIENARPGGVPLQTFCTSSMANLGGHARCGVKGGTVFDCDGQVKRIPWSAQVEAPKAPNPSQRVKARADPQPPPQTVEEMARRAKEATNTETKEKTRTLGENIGDATKKTWRCVTSLFSRCLE